MMDIDIQQSNLDDLTSVYRDQSYAAEADKTLRAIRMHESQVQLSHLLRDHTKDREGITRQEEIHQRNAFDALLEFYSIMEIASLIHYVPARLPEDFSETARWNLSEPMVKRYYEEFYPVLLPKLFLSRLKQELSLHEKLLADPMPVHRLFVEFLDIVSRVRDDEALKTFLWFLDDGRRDGYGIEDTLAVLGNPEQYLERLLKPPTERNPLDLSLQGLQGFLAFCLEFDDLLQRSHPYPLFQSAQSHYFSDWFENIREKVDRRVNRAIQAFLNWSADKNEETVQAEEMVQAKEEIKAYVERIEVAVKRLVSEAYGQALWREADKLPVASAVTGARLRTLLEGAQYKVRLYELADPIQESQLKVLRESLESLQGNILRGHGRDRSIHIFLSFKNGQTTEVKEWIKGLAERLTSAQQQIAETEQYRYHHISGRLFMNFFLSAQGYEYLYPTQKGKLRFNDAAFLRSMKAAQHRLNDPPKEAWEAGYQKDIHAMVLLADDNGIYLLQEANKLIDDVKTHAEICAVEHGRVMWHGQAPIEHFGFVDSRSQPLFFQSDIERAKQKRDEASVWNPGAGPNVVLVPDPYGRREYDSGSYLVFHKLEQHVRAFKERELKLAQTLGLTGEEAKRAGALVVGRFEDGTPVVLQPTAGRSTNNFSYDDDPYGQRCPFQAHIRKVNPRKQGIPRIVRRGITYGEWKKGPWDNPSLAELPVGGVGLLFMCYQRNIAQQFEALQYLWASDPRLPRGQAPGIDPVIGQPGGNGVGQQKWPAQWDDPREQHKPFDFHGFVTFKGGEYFFAPSIYFLRNIEKAVD
jgi:Dyp-type peroxidase family